MAIDKPEDTESAAVGVDKLRLSTLDDKSFISPVLISMIAALMCIAVLVGGWASQPCGR
jgi:hypothetical protein